MMSDWGPRRALPGQSSGSGHTLATSRQLHVIDLSPSKRVCFYKSGDPQFNGLRMVVNSRTFKTFDALLDSLSKKVPLPFGVRNITTPRGVHTVHTLDQLEDGKSYICSDSRKVKPINLALARKKPPPWYHARPGTARRRTVQRARTYPGVAKRLIVFRNGDPNLRHTLKLQKRNVPTFKSLLDFISEVMRFRVMKLHTPGGGRVDSLPALILCSGTVVAAGKEPFKPLNYNAQSPAPTWLPTHRRGPRRPKPVLGQRKSTSSNSKSRNFSQSSERYFMNQIQNSIMESLCDFPSNSTESVELEPGHMLESVAETEADTFLENGTERRGSCLPEDDDIEKSFRVNQDGSMTVEMKVRLTIKEEETIHWTTTLTRSSVANQLNLTCLPESECQLEQESDSPQTDPLEHQRTAVSFDTVSGNKPKDDDDDYEPPSLDNRVTSEDGYAEEDVKGIIDAVSPRRAPTPGPKGCSKKQASTERIISMTAEEIQEGQFSSYSCTEQAENGAMTELCMFKKSSTRPVPKPRRLGSVEINYRNRELPTFKSAGMSDILQIENSTDEVTETVLNIYEQQTCQESFHGNSHFCTQGVSMYGVHFARPATSEMAQNITLGKIFESVERPCTAAESISIWRADSMSLPADGTLPSLRTGADYTPPPMNKVTNAQKLFTKPTTGKDSSQVLSDSGKEKYQQGIISKVDKMSSIPKASKKRVRRIKSPGKGRKQSAAKSEERRRVKTFSSAGFLKKIYGGKPRSVKGMKKQQTEKQLGGSTTESSETPDVITACPIKDTNILSPVKDNNSDIPFENNMSAVSPPKGQPRGVLRHQKSMHKSQTMKESCDISESMPLPAFNSSSSVINEYVELWLENTHSLPAIYPDEETQKAEVMNQVGSDSCKYTDRDVNSDRIGVKVETDHIEKTEKQEISEPKSLPQHKSLQTAPPPEKNIIAQQIVPNDTDNPVDEKEISDTQHYIQDAPSRHPPEDRLSSNSPISDQGPPATDKPLEKSVSVQTSVPSTLSEVPLSRNPSVKRAKLVSNISFERKMSLRKASLEKSALTRDASSETTTAPTPHKTAPRDELESSSTSYCISASPPSLSSKERTLPSSPSSSDTQVLANFSIKGTDTNKRQSPIPTPTGGLSPEPQIKKEKFISYSSLEKKLSTRKTSCEKSVLPNDSPAKGKKLSSSPSLRRRPLEGNHSVSSHDPSTKATKILNTSPSAERQSLQHKSGLQKSHSQSSEDLSPPTRPKSKQTFHQLSLEDGSKPESQTLRSTERSQSKSQLNALSKKSTSGLAKPEESHVGSVPMTAKISNTEQENLSDDQKAVYSDHSNNSECKDEQGSLEETSEAECATSQYKGKQLLETQRHSAVPQGCATQSKDNQVKEEEQDRRDEDQLNTEQPHITYMDVKLKRESALEGNRCSSGEQQPDVECKEPPVNSEDSMFSPGDESSSDEDGKIKLSTDKYVDENVSRDRNISKSAVDKQPEVEGEQSEVQSKQLKQMWNKNLSDYKSLSSSEEAEWPSTNDTVRLNASGNKSISRPEREEQCSSEEDRRETLHKVQPSSSTETLSDPVCHSVEGDDRQWIPSCGSLNSSREESVSSPDAEVQSSAEEDQPAEDITKLREESHKGPSSRPESPTHSEKQQRRQPSNSDCRGLKVSSEESTSSPDVEEQSSSEEEVPEVECKELQVIIEESFSGPQEARYRVEEENNGETEQQATRERRENTPKEHEVSSQNDEPSTDDLGCIDRLICGNTAQMNSQNILWSTPSHLTYNKDFSALKKHDSVLKQSDVDRHRSCEEHTEEELSSGEKDSSSEGARQPGNTDGYAEEFYQEDQEGNRQEKLPNEDTNTKEATEELCCQLEEMKAQSVSERIRLLEKQVTDVQQKSDRPERTSVQVHIKNNTPPETEVEVVTPEPKASGSRSAPQSSLSFSYDSSSVISRQPEGNIVRSIKEMFLAKSVPDVQEQRGNSSTMSDSRAEIWDSGGRQSQESNKLLGSETDSSRTSIAKGFVRRTIERLYGKKDESEKPTSAPKQKKKEGSGVLSPVDLARSKIASDLPYFNSSNTLDTLSEATRCIAFNAQVRPDDSAPIDTGGWLLGGNAATIRKSISDPVGISKSFERSPPNTETRKDTEENAPYSFFSTKSEQGDKLVATKCTYFSLPHASDSEQCPDDPCAVSMGSASGESGAETKEAEAPKVKAQMNGILPSFSGRELKMSDNKVHPLMEGPPGGKAVVVQPSKGQGVVQRQTEDFDVLDVLYTFCGEHCPIL